MTAEVVAKGYQKINNRKRLGTDATEWRTAAVHVSFEETFGLCEFHSNSIHTIDVPTLP